MRSLPPPFSSSDFSEPLIQSNTFTSLSPGSGSFTQTRRDNTVIQMTPLALESRRRSELPDLPRQSGTLRGVSTQRLLRAVQDLTGCSWLSPPSRCGSRELPRASFPKAKGTGTAAAPSSLESTAHCGQSSRWDPKGFPHLSGAFKGNAVPAASADPVRRSWGLPGCKSGPALSSGAGGEPGGVFRDWVGIRGRC